MVGLTGGIGSGKSAAATRLAALGAVILDADQIAREVVQPGTEGLAEIVRTFGDRVRAPDGGLDRAALGEIVFGDDAARARLEAIVHPRVRARTARLAAAAPADAVLVNDVPLLVEVGLAPTYHLVVVVETARDIRVARLVRDRGMPAEQAHQRIRAQVDDARRRAAADVVLRNDSTLAELHDQIDDLWRDRLVPYERNVRQRRVVAPAGPVVLVPPDPGWPAQFERLAARIRHAVGSGDLRIDHIGATAVPQLPTEDVIEIQVTVASSTESLVERLAAAGFPPYPEPRRDTTDHGAGAERWPERRHGGADPARPVVLHLRVAGTPGWRAALLLRDHLRADAGRRAEYLRLRQRLVAEVPDRAHYAAAEDRWLADEQARAERWAAGTGWRP